MTSCPCRTRSRCSEHELTSSFTPLLIAVRKVGNCTPKRLEPAYAKSKKTKQQVDGQSQMTLPATTKGAARFHERAPFVFLLF
jgi:hypothetical protein